MVVHLDNQGIFDALKAEIIAVYTKSHVGFCKADGKQMPFCHAGRNINKLAIAHIECVALPERSHAPHLCSAKGDGHSVPVCPARVR